MKLTTHTIATLKKIADMPFGMPASRLTMGCLQVEIGFARTSTVNALCAAGYLYANYNQPTRTDRRYHLSSRGRAALERPRTV